MEKINQDQRPNFRDKEGRLFLVRCFACGGEYGRENWAPAKIREILSELCEVAHNTKEGFNASPLIEKATDEILRNFRLYHLKHYDKWHSAGWKDREQQLLKQMKGLEEVLDEPLKKCKEISKKLPIDIERHGGLYCQGMHAGIDACINLLLNYSKKASTKIRELMGIEQGETGQGHVELD